MDYQKLVMQEEETPETPETPEEPKTEEEATTPAE